MTTQGQKHRTAPREGLAITFLRLHQSHAAKMMTLKEREFLRTVRDIVLEGKTKIKNLPLIILE